VCLEGVREADAVVLLLGAQYGEPQLSGLSPTHEEYREARGKKPIFAFVQDGVTYEQAQAAFVEEVSTWEAGGYRQSFDTPNSLAAKVTRGLHDWELSQKAGPVDEASLKACALALLPRQPNFSPGRPTLNVAVAGAPTQQILRPGDLDNQSLQRDLEREALYGDPPVLDRRQGTQVTVSGTVLTIKQATAEITVDEQGGIRIALPARDATADSFGSPGIASLVDEDVRDKVSAAIRYAGWALDLIDPTHWLRRLALVCQLDGVGYMPWRTRAEVAASPNRASGSRAGLESAQSPPEVLPRADLLFSTEMHAEDITVRLRRQVQG
jgi:hypothetical protein